MFIYNILFKKNQVSLNNIKDVINVFNQVKLISSNSLNIEL